MIGNVHTASRLRLFIAAVALAAMLNGQTVRSEDGVNAARLPSPSDDLQKNALKLLKDAYNPYPPKTSATRIELAKKLVEDAKTSADDAAAQYVLYREAGDLFASGGDFDDAMLALDEMAKRFAVDANAVKLAALKAGRGSRMNAAAASMASAAAISIGWAAMRDGEFATASQAAALAEAFVSEVRDKKAVAESQTLSIGASRAAQESKRAGAAAEKLRSDPNDPSANRVVGEFLCLWQGRWSAGLPLLKKSDSVFKAAAETDEGDPTTAASQFTLAERWYALSAKESDIVRSRIRERAAFWYDRAAPRLKGLQQTLTRRRLDEIDEADASNPLSNSPAAMLTRKLNDPSQWIERSGKWQISADKLRGEGVTGVTFAQRLPGDIVLSFRINVVNGMRPRIYFDGTGMMYGNEGYALGLNPFGVAVTSGGNFPYANNHPYLLRFNFSSGNYEVEVDGKVAVRGTCTATPTIRLRLSGGDSWSAGTTEFWDFRVESASRPVTP